jgi:hypothetical protein
MLSTRINSQCISGFQEPLEWSINSSNGMVDNEDIYGQNGTLDAGEDVLVI